MTYVSCQLKSMSRKAKMKVTRSGRVQLQNGTMAYMMRTQSWLSACSMRNNMASCAGKTSVRLQKNPTTTTIYSPNQTPKHCFEAHLNRYH